MTEPEPISSIARGYFAARFAEVEAITCTCCGAGDGEQCWEWSRQDSLVRIQRVVPHRERFESWQESTTPTE